MKVKKKRVGTKFQIRAEKEKGRRISAAIFLAFILLVVVFSAYFSYTFLTQSQNQANHSASELRAAIVDQASLSPAGGFNETFIEKASNILKQEGYTVDYYSGEKVTVDFFRDLPALGYKILVLRVHSTATGSGATGQEEIPVVFFTSELYSTTKYVHEQLANQVFQASYVEQERPYYFAVGPQFIASCTRGAFNGTLVVMMGCEGLSNTWMAQAFVEKGAKVYIGWDKGIFFSHADAATINLLQYLLLEKQTINQAVENTMKEVGADPAENSLLAYYPLEVGDQTIEKP